MPLGTRHVTPPPQRHNKLAFAVLVFRSLAFVLRHVDPHSANARRGAFEIMVGEGAGQGYRRLVVFSDH
ncbi:UNVERIFIED_ORG: hypothetical protein QE448_001063 [Rhizobium sp. SORGH_AS285]|nr:hypothetical protein [Rhizobium sp. SORGH_AS_0285]